MRISGCARSTERTSTLVSTSILITNGPGQAFRGSMRHPGLGGPLETIRPLVELVSPFFRAQARRDRDAILFDHML